ncbi:MBL fold metallo-hydrolase [Streptomyces sp. SP18CS02]|uniref:MBL fold metallo-hydrolase n=1 Tax=Streptomyces sp. SP18CS02 TaxID=3002531 RepID=UPI002E79F704|nr:MBL fold metallo-hydrolase [Streptomyces sp. SP18CS02]MEE1756383.1 MBL fold metallo-hydrolase [Streptomyces sp. SP18CS02]
MTETEAFLSGRRTVLRGAAAAGVALPLLTTPTAATARTTAPAPATGRRIRPDAASLRWLGTSGWRFDFDGRTVLFDPYITRFRTGLFGPKVPGGPAGFDERTELVTDGELVARHAGRPQLILVSHSHWDHINDVPHLARTTGARVVGTETTYHLLCALGVDPGQISVVKGGEVLDFDGCTVDVVSSLHSRNARHSYFAPGSLNAPPAHAPRTISDLPEGDTLAFQLTIGGGPSVFLMGASDFSERAAEGLRPDIATVAVPTSTATHRYAPRLLRALGNPATIVPVHWDDFEEPLSSPPRRDPSTRLEALLEDVRTYSPASRVVVPDYRTVYGADMRPLR